MGIRLNIISGVIYLGIWGKVVLASGQNVAKEEFREDKNFTPFSYGGGNETIRDPKLFPYFLIQFPNEPCTSSDGRGGGVCVSAKQCRQAGGMTVGVCASGFGACCRYRKSCGEDGGDVHVRENSTDIKSSNKSSSCRFVLPKMRGICQVRLDFTELQYGQGFPSGDCSPTKLEIRGGGVQLDLCGNMTGQHVYLNYGNAEKLYIHASDFISDTDKYSIQVNYIRCNSGLSVPSHCTQHYSGVSGKIKSLNWPEQQLNNQEYTVCIASPGDNASRRSGRMTTPNQKIHWSTCEDKDDDGNIKNPFLISGKLEDSPILDPRECTTDFIQIFGGDRQCGNHFRDVTVSSLPYLLHVRFDDKEGEGKGNGSPTGGVTVSKPREGCESLNTQDTKCQDAPGTGSMDSVMENETEFIDGGICRCINAPGRNLNRLNVDIKNTGFCLSYKIIVE